MLASLILCALISLLVGIALGLGLARLSARAWPALARTPIRRPGPAPEAAEPLTLLPVLTTTEAGWAAVLDAGIADLGPGYRLLTQISLRKCLDIPQGQLPRTLRGHRLDFAILGPDRRLIAALNVAAIEDPAASLRWHQLAPILTELGLATLEINAEGTGLEALFESLLWTRARPVPPVAVPVPTPVSFEAPAIARAANF